MEAVWLRAGWERQLKEFRLFGLAGGRLFAKAGLALTAGAVPCKVLAAAPGTCFIRRASLERAVSTGRLCVCLWCPLLGQAVLWSGFPKSLHSCLTEDGANPGV